MLGTAAASLHRCDYVVLRDPAEELVMHFLTMSSLYSVFLPGYIFFLCSILFPSSVLAAFLWPHFLLFTQHLSGLPNPKMHSTAACSTCFQKLLNLGYEVYLAGTCLKRNLKATQNCNAFL